MTIAQEEIFGPVLAVIPYDTEDDAVRIANDSPYGLAGSVFTTDNEKAMKIASKIRTGTYAVNMYAFDPGAPFGGYKNSGIGRENGPEGIEQYTQAKSVLLPFGYKPEPTSHDRASRRKASHGSRLRLLAETAQQDSSVMRTVTVEFDGVLHLQVDGVVVDLRRIDELGARPDPPPDGTAAMNRTLSDP